ncbi:MAG: universal stress protein [Thermodesulfobacteriota bacterium]
MAMFSRILLATHGTAGALAAEDLAVELASRFGASLHCLHVIHEDWQWMTGDDWLNTSASRNQFARHVENELNGEAEAIMKRVSEKASGKSVSLTTLKKVGNPAAVILLTAQEIGADVVVMGSRQNRQDTGFRARIGWPEFLGKCRVPVLLAPPVS